MTAEDERAAVVAWLRAEALKMALKSAGGDKQTLAAIRARVWVARQIERGDHIKEDTDDAA